MEAASMYLIYKLYFSLINNLIIVLFLFRFSENNMHTVFSIKRKIQVDISHILGNLITVIFNYQILRKPLKILSL